MTTPVDTFSEPRVKQATLSCHELIYETHLDVVGGLIWAVPCRKMPMEGNLKAVRGAVQYLGTCHRLATLRKYLVVPYLLSTTYY